MSDSDHYSKNLIDITSVFEFVHNKQFTQIQEDAKSKGVEIRENGDLFLVIQGKHVDGDGNGDNTDVSSLEFQSNGIIFQKNTNAIVCASQNMFTEVKDLTMIHADPSPFRAEYCEDGTLIRLYNYNGEWRTATNRCIDATKSHWISTKNFDTLFWELFDKSNIEQLDPTCTYLFILLHSENRIVVRHDQNRLVFISKIWNTPSVDTVDDKSHYVLYEDFTNIFAETQQYVKGADQLETLDTTEDYHKRGLLIKVLQSNGYYRIYKYDFEHYTKQKHIRGNVPNIKFRYLELLNKPETLNQLFRLYSEHKSEFIELRNSLHGLSMRIYQLYIESHIKHKIQIDESSPFYGFLKTLHAQYKNSKTPIRLNDVKERLKHSNRWILVNFLNTT